MEITSSPPGSAATSPRDTRRCRGQLDGLVRLGRDSPSAGSRCEAPPRRGPAPACPSARWPSASPHATQNQPGDLAGSSTTEPENSAAPRPPASASHAAVQRRDPLIEVASLLAQEHLQAAIPGKLEDQVADPSPFRSRTTRPPKPPRRGKRTPASREPLPARQEPIDGKVPFGVVNEEVPAPSPSKSPATSSDRARYSRRETARYMPLVHAHAHVAAAVGLRRVPLARPEEEDPEAVVEPARDERLAEALPAVEETVAEDEVDAAVPVDVDERHRGESVVLPEDQEGASGICPPAPARKTSTSTLPDRIPGRTGPFSHRPRTRST